MFNKRLSVLKKSILVLACALVLPVFLNTATASAGGINSEESRVLTVARGSFEYEGEKYVAKRYFVDQLIAYMSRDDIDRTAEQADSAISKIYANVETGVKDCYIVKIHNDSESEDEKAKEGKVVKEKDGSLIAYDESGSVVLKSDGLLRNTGYSAQGILTALAVMGIVFVLAIACSIATKIISGLKKKSF